MKLAKIYGLNQEFKIEEAEIPKIDDDEVLVSVQAAGICGTDLHIQDGEFLNVPGVENAKMSFPLVMGHEISGIVEKTGNKIQNLSKGDRVVVNPVVTCNNCFYCLSGNKKVCENKHAYGEAAPGGFSQYSKFAGKSVYKIPDKLSFEEAAIMADSLATPFEAMKLLNVGPGDTVALYGVGGLGINAVQIGKLRGAEIIAVDILDDKLKLAKEFGADHVINAVNEDPIKKIKELTHNRGADKSLEIVGGKKTVELAIGSVRPGGTMGIIGGSNDNFSAGIRQILWNNITIVPCYGDLPTNFTNMVDLLVEGKLNLKKIITHRFPLQDINIAFKTLREKIGNPLRIVILPQE